MFLPARRVGAQREAWLGWFRWHSKATSTMDNLILCCACRGSGCGKPLRLEMVKDLEGLFMDSAADDGETVGHGDCTTVWIHSDDTILLGSPFNHYSVISLL